MRRSVSLRSSDQGSGQVFLSPRVSFCRGTVFVLAMALLISAGGHVFATETELASGDYGSGGLTWTLTTRSNPSTYNVQTDSSGIVIYYSGSLDLRLYKDETKEWLYTAQHYVISDFGGPANSSFATSSG